jgi:hypothetical protein
MKSAQFKRYGGSDVIEINQTTPTPTLAAGNVLVEIKAAGINPIDWKIREGYMQQMIPIQFPSTLGMDFHFFSIRHHLCVYLLYGMNHMVHYPSSNQNNNPQMVVSLVHLCFLSRSLQLLCEFNSFINIIIIF